MKDLECPYCNHEFEACHDDGHLTDESETYEQECPKCEKNFAVNVTIIFSYSTHKADCMNGGSHDFTEEKNPSPWNVGYPMCKACGNRIMVDLEANKKAVEEWRNK